MHPGLVPCVRCGVAREHRREAQPQRRERHPEQEGDGPKPIGTRKISGSQRGERHRTVAGRLVEPHGEAPAIRTDEVNLHDNGHRPAQPLIDAEEHIGRGDPAPGWRPHTHERDRKAEEPSRDQQAFPAGHLGVPTRHEVGQGLHDPEADEERKDGAFGGEAKILLGDKRQHRAL